MPLRRLAFAVAALAAPSSAVAQGPCTSFKLPQSALVFQHNGWTAAVWLDTRNRVWRATATDAGLPGPLYYKLKGSVSWRSATAPLVKFTVAWNDGSTGVYQGSIAANGRISGITFDARKPGASTGWTM